MKGRKVSNVSDANAEDKVRFPGSKSAAGPGPRGSPSPNACRGGRRGELQTAGPSLDLLLGLVLGDAVALLDAADQLVLLAVDHAKIVIGEFSPLFLHLAGELFLVALDPVPIHRSLLLWLQKTLR